MLTVVLLSVLVAAVYSANDFLSNVSVTYNKVIPCLQRSKLVKSDLKQSLKPFTDEAAIQAHYEDLLQKTRIFRDIPMHESTGYAGPWIENKFIEHFMSKPLSHFRGMIPLFIQWVDIHCYDFTPPESKNKSIPTHSSMPDLVGSMLRDDLIYITVSQDDQGLGLKFQERFPNVLVLSAGGFGHIPIPLIKDEIKHVEYTGKTQHPAGFYGNIRPRLSRSTILAEMRRFLDKEGIGLHMDQSNDWRANIANTLFNMAPRGYGRTSYRLAEVIQTGRIPVYLYDDVEWLPYLGTPASVHEFGVSGQIHHLEKTAKQIKDHISNGRVQELVNKAQLNREFYLYSGVLQQIELFLQDPFGSEGGYLRCIDVPVKDH